MKYSFNTWAFSHFPCWVPSYPIEEVIKRLAEIGYDALELGCAQPQAWPYFTDKEKRASVRKTLKEFLLCFRHQEVDLVETLLQQMFWNENGPNSTGKTVLIWAQRWMTVKHFFVYVDGIFMEQERGMHGNGPWKASQKLQNMEQRVV